MPADDVAAIEAAISAVKVAMEGADLEDLKNKTAELQQAAMKIGQAAYGGAAAGGAGAEAAAEPKEDENVVDAEFTEKEKKEDK